MTPATEPTTAAAPKPPAKTGGRTGPAIHRKLKGEPYCFTPNADGFGVVPLTSPTDKFHRSYQVYIDPLTGAARKCTCPDHVERGNVCKHMDGAWKIVLTARRDRALDLVAEAGRLVAAAAKLDEGHVPAWHALRETWAAVRRAKDVREAAAALRAGRNRVTHLEMPLRLLNMALDLVA